MWLPFEGWRWALCAALLLAPAERTVNPTMHAGNLCHQSSRTKYSQALQKVRILKWSLRGSEPWFADGQV